jgi:Tfp pilus assembly protein PilF
VTQIKLLSTSLATALISLLVAGCASTPQNGETTAGERRPLTHRERAVLLIELANASLSEGDPTAALENLFKAEREDASLPELYHSKALAYFAKHDASAALAQGRKALELKPDYADAASTVGKLLMDLGRSGEAIPYLERAAADPIYREAYKPLTSLGIIEYRRGSLEKAESYFSRSIQNFPATSCIAYYYRGHLRMKASRLKEAIKDYDLASQKACAGFADAQLALGMAYEQSKQYQLARKKYVEIQARYPQSSAAEQAISHLRYLP